MFHDIFFISKALKENSIHASKNESLKMTLQKFHDVILKTAPEKKLLNLEMIGKPVVRNHHPLGE